MNADQEARHVADALRKIATTLAGCGHDKAVSNIDLAVGQINEHFRECGHSRDESLGAPRNG